MQSDPNPLPRCPDSPNCERESRTFSLAPGALFEQAQQALQAMNPAELSVQPADRRAQAVVRVFFFKDDVEIAVTSTGEGATLHIRSASRTGHSDLGVNRRRVKRFFRALEKELTARS